MIRTERHIGSSSSIEEQLFDRQGRLVRLTCRGGDGKESHLSFEYDQDGNRLDRNIRAVRDKDGSRTETQPVSGVSSWSTDGLHGIGFGTFGASVARTKFRSGGVPTETLFEDAEGHELSKIHYVCDDNGRINEVIQYRGSAFPLDPRGSSWAAVAHPLQTDAIGALIEPGGEQFRVSFIYDERERVIEIRTYFSGQKIAHKLMTYNDNGDILTSADGETAFRFEYEYDKRANWIKKTTHHHVGCDIETRYVMYYD